MCLTPLDDRRPVLPGVEVGVPRGDLEEGGDLAAGADAGHDVRRLGVLLRVGNLEVCKFGFSLDG